MTTKLIPAAMIVAFVSGNVGAGDSGASRIPARPHDPRAVVLTRERFGARGDGKADDAPALQKAIDALQETRGGGVVFVPSGRYRLGRTLDLWKGVRLVGCGQVRPTLVLAADTPAFRDGRCRYLVHFRDARRAGGRKQLDARNTTFASGILNVNVEIAPGYPHVAAVRYNVAQLCTLKWMDFRLADAAAGIEQIGNEIVGCRFFGGRHAVVTGRTSAGWQSLLMDCAFEGQSEAAVQTHAAGLTVIGCSFRRVPRGIVIPKGKTERLYLRDTRFEDVAEAAITLDATTEPSQQINVDNVACIRTPRVLDFPGSGDDRTSRGIAGVISSLSHGLHVDQACTKAARAGHATRVTARGTGTAEPPAPSLLPPLPPQASWVNALEAGAKGDGRTDDTYALRKALAGGRCVYLPCGRYRVTDTLVLDGNAALIGLHPRATMLVVPSGTNYFGDPNRPKPVLRAARGARCIVSGLGIDPGRNRGAVAVQWSAGPQSLLDDVFFQYGRGPSGAGQCYGLWVDGGAGTFKSFWAANGQARNGLYVTDSAGPGTVLLASVEHHMGVEVELRNVRNWRFHALQTETEGGEGEKSTAVRMTGCRDLTFTNLYLYRTSRTRSPHPHGLLLKDCRDIRLRGVHNFSLSKFPYTNTAFDADTRLALPQREAAFVQIGPPRPEGARPVKIILDTDLDSDCDDLGALAVLHALADRREAEILAVITTTDDQWSPCCADAVNTYYGRGDIPVGVLDPKRGHEGTRSRYTRPILAACPHDLRSYEAAEDAVALYRRTLAAQPDGSVALVTVGHLTSLARLMQSKPDKHSPLGGLDLVARKVRLWSCMGGQYPKGKEPNFYRPDPASTAYAVRHWPTKAVFSGAEIGRGIQTGARLAQTPADNPVRIGYEAYFRAPGRSRASWDQTAVLYAVRGLGSYWTAETAGSCHVSPDGSNEWRPSPDRPHAYLKARMPAKELARVIEDLMIAPPKRRPAARR